jgi:hypothetical protein
LQPPSVDGTLAERGAPAGIYTEREEIGGESELCGPAFAKATVL